MQNPTGPSGYSEIEPDLGLLKEVPITYAKSNGVLPIRLSDGKLIGLVSGENGYFALRELAIERGVDPFPIETDMETLLEEINRLYGQVGSAEEVMQSISGEDLTKVATEFESPRDLLELTAEAPIIRLLNALLQQAVKERASDIHIEPYERELEVRMRVDGVLRTVLRPPKAIQDALISRVKIMSGLDIAEKRLPQDGRIRLLIGGRDIDVRVSVIPTVHGERAVLRILHRQGLLGMEDLGMDTSLMESFQRHLMAQSGIILVTGPTGSGKTTTLYAALRKVHTSDKNIITIEDPVEYQLRGVGQMQVNPRIGLTFASGLRSILRQDPDVIMVGEIRDLETAEIAIQASLTGHLVLSTLHTNDAPSAVTRLLDMGVEPFLLSSSLLCVLAQRLVRLICPYCRQTYVPDEEERMYLNRYGFSVETLQRGEGCDRCQNTGYLGRTGIFEFLRVTNALRKKIRRVTSSHELREVAISEGMIPLLQAGLKKVADGVTTLEEVLRVTEALKETLSDRNV